MKFILASLFIFFCEFAYINTSLGNPIENHKTTSSSISSKIQQEEGSVFKEVTQLSGIDYQGVSFGHAWSDVDLDGYPDLFCTGHGRANLYMNQQDGTFKTIEVPFIKKVEDDGTVKYYDMHGVTFADVNHDGYPDVYIQLGGDMGHSGGKENILFLNQEGTIIFENRAAEYQIIDSLGRGRATLFFDQDKDDYVDFLNVNFSRPDELFNSSLYSYNSGLEVFDRKIDVGFDEYSIRTTSMIQSRQKNLQHIVNVTDYNDFLQVYDYSQVPFKKLYEQKLFGIRDVAIADFNGDAEQDIFITANRYSSEANLQNDTSLFVYLYAKAKGFGYNDENKVSFKTDGDITIESTIYPYMDETKVYWRIGKNSYHPSTNVFTLSASNPDNHNFASLCLLCLGVNIGYNTTDGKWEIYNTDPIDNLQSAIKITSSKPITDIQTYSFQNSDLFSIDRLLLSDGNGGYVEDPKFLVNADNWTTGVSAVAADFDNDMDVDILISCQGSSVNYPNRYYENDGKGKFTLIEGFGAESAFGGRSGSITSSDFDNDGFLDVFVENGEGQLGEGARPLHFNDGPYRLYRNKGNDNHWIKFHITDQESLGNKLAIGTAVNCYVKGKKQVRLKGNEHHAYAQNDPVVHFGMGGFVMADSIEIIWPDGDRNVFYSVEADSMYIISGKDVQLGGEKPLVFDNCQEIIFPNPTSGDARLVQLDNSQKIQSIEIVNYLGQSVFSEEVQDYMDSFLLSTKDWSNGTYIVKVFYEDESYCYSRFQILR